MAGSRKHRPSTLVFHHDGSPLGVRLDLDVCVLHFVVAHVEPVGQVVLGRTVVILDTHGIPRHIPDGQTAFSETETLFCLQGQLAHGQQGSQ